MRFLFALLFFPALVFAQAGGPPFIPVNMMKVSETPVSNTVDAVVALVFMLAAGAAYGLLKSLKSELAPTEDRGFFIGFMLAPEGSTLQYTDQYARQLEGIYQGIPEINSAFVVVAPGLERPNPVNTSLSFVMLKPWEERSRSRMDITASLRLRLRPILMTTAAMVLGAVPLAIAHGAGAESRSPIGWVIVGGLLLGTLLTLFVIPVAYILLTRERTTHVSQPASEHP